MKGLIRSGFFKGQFEQVTVIDPANNKDFRFLDKDEIRYRGKFYDVVSFSVSGNTITFLCINDTKEETMVAHFDKIITLAAGMNSTEKNRTSQALLYHIIKHAFVKRYSFTPPSEYSLLFKWIEPASKLNSVYLIPFSPPPEII
jgi:hypothetical protein